MYVEVDNVETLVVWVPVVILGVLLLILMGFLANERSRSTARRHAESMSRVTGVPADEIYEEMVRRNETPGEWAVRHGRDPWTFLPEPGSLEERDDSSSGP